MSSYHIHFDTELRNPLKLARHNLHSMVQDDTQAHRITVTVTDNGAPVTLGTIKAFFIRPDKQMITITGTKSGNTATVILTEDCYKVRGRGRLTVKNTTTDAITSIAIADCNI